MSLINIPRHLSGDSAQGLIEHEPIAQFEIGSMKNFVYLILDWKSKSAAIVDPQRDLAPLLNALELFQFKLTSVFLTHTHHDHTAGVEPLLSKYPDLPIRVGAADQYRLSKKIMNSSGLKIIEDQEELTVGSLSIQALHTPGHSAGEFCYFLSNEGNAMTHPYLFTGDTVFIRDCGRTDGESGDDAQMFNSLQRIKTLPEETVFLVGHHYKKECATTLASELKNSPPFQCLNVDELKQLP